MDEDGRNLGREGKKREIGKETKIGYREMKR